MIGSYKNINYQISNQYYSKCLYFQLLYLIVEFKIECVFIIVKDFIYSLNNTFFYFYSTI